MYTLLQSFSALKNFDSARTQFFQDLVIALAFKTFLAPLNFALILKLLGFQITSKQQFLLLNGPKWAKFPWY